MDRPAKRRRSVSPINARCLRPKRSTLPHLLIQPTSAKTIQAEAEYSLLHPSIPTTPINVAVESINERATRLGLGNADSQDIEMEACSQSEAGQRDEDEADSNSDEDTEKGVENKNENVAMQASHPSILPLHKPHPIAYQQHLALIASNRSKKNSNCNHLQSNQIHNGTKKSLVSKKLNKSLPNP